MRDNPVRGRLLDGGPAYGIFAAEFFTPGFCQIAAGFRCIACGTDASLFQSALGGMIGALKGDGQGA